MESKNNEHKTDNIPEQPEEKSEGLGHNIAGKFEDLGHDISKGAEKAKESAARDLHHEVSKIKHEPEKIKYELEDAANKIKHPKKSLSSSKDFDEELHSLHEEIRESFDHSWWRRMLSAPVDSKKLPVGMKVLGVLLILGALYGLGNVVFNIVEAVQRLQDGAMNPLGTSTIVVIFLNLSFMFLMAVAVLGLGISVFRNRRRYAALLIYTIYVFLIGGAICSLMLSGVSPRLIVYGVAFVLMVAFQTYLDPGLREERTLQRKLRDKELKTEQEEGTLGRDNSGKGYIDLNFFNLFWIFVVCSMLGDGIETLFHFFVVEPGQWQDRAGLLFGPFSPIYGFGALLMTIFLNRFYKRSLIIIFLFSAIIGGAFETFVSIFMQYSFGAVAWDYTGQWLSLFGGRTCGIAMIGWGSLGVIWIKVLLPILLKLVNLIPWKWRYTITTIAAVLMATDCIMTLQALDCWYERLAGNPINSPLQQFYSDFFNNDFMSHRFQSMSIHPDIAVRGS